MNISDQMLAPALSSSRRVGPAVKRTPAIGLPVRFLLGVLLTFYFPAFTIQLAMDPITGRWTGSPILQVITISTELIVLAVIGSSAYVRMLVFKCWPILTMIACAFVSAAWSYNRAATIQAANTYMTTALLGLVIAGLLPGFQCIRFVIRTMAAGCLLSIVWVICFPETAIHQLTDPYQTVHAGLWRGVFSHKQGLGYFSGLTVGLLLFYRTSIFPAPIWILSLGCSITCLVGTQSATGIVAALITPAFLIMAYFVCGLPVALRRPMLIKFAIGAVLIGAAFKFGILDYVVVKILGKSTDLTGRADFWPIILANFYSSGYSLLGAGFGSNFATNLSEWSVDNGFIDKFLEFGYALSPFVFGAFVAILWGAIRLLIANPSGQARTNIFPMAVWSVILILNISESNFMTKCLSTVLTSMAFALIVQQKQLNVYLRRASRNSSPVTMSNGV